MITWKDIMSFVVKGNPEPDLRVEKTNEEWRNVLSEDEYRIARKGGTEYPNSGDLCSSYETGLYSCVCCGEKLFESNIKFNSGTGWPSFTQPYKSNSIKYIKDESMGMIRVEIQCNSCDSHLGHVFPDGPEPSGLRYCVNSLSLKFNNND